MIRFDATISERPGGLARLATAIAEEEASVIDIAHDRAFSGEDIDSVVVHCVVETRGFDHIESLKARLIKEGFLIRFQSFSA